MFPNSRLRSIVFTFVALMFALAVPFAGSAQNEAALAVGIKESPPFTMKDSDGTWSGLSVDLWEEAAQELGMTFEYREMELDAILVGVANEELDVGIGAITATAEREAMLDFSHSYFDSGLGIATRQERSVLSAYVRAVFNPGFASAVAVLAVVIFIFGFLLWIFERKANKEQFGGPAHEGIGNAFWWSAVTMTTVGYGDKAPTSLMGRMIGFVWMFAAIMIISSLTAGITSAMNASYQRDVVGGSADLMGAQIGTLGGSTSETYLRERGVRVRGFGDLDEALMALSDERIDAVVYDMPLLQWSLLRNEYVGVKILPDRLSPQQYALALRPSSPIREEVNQEILDTISSERWRSLKIRYFGE